MTIKLGIIGAGWIADKMAETLTGLKNPEVIPYAISSRDLAKAQAFADHWGFPKAYGSYEEMLADPATHQRIAEKVVAGLEEYLQNVAVAAGRTPAKKGKK